MADQKPASKKLFERFVMAGFSPMTKFIEDEHLQTELTPDDIAKVVLTIEEGLNNYCQFLIQYDRKNTQASPPQVANQKEE